jgi:hypothetical protein
MASKRQVYLVPMIQTLMTGVTHYEVWPGGKVRLHYQDHTTETAKLPIPVPDDVFAVVGAVQAKRP